MTQKIFVQIIGKTFLFATTFQVLMISGISLIMGTDTTVYTRDLYQIPVIAFLSALPGLIFMRVAGKEESRWKWTIRRLLHFALTGGIVFTALTFFGWIRPGNIIVPVISFIVIYGIFSIGSEMQDREFAKKLNEKLNQKLNEELDDQL